MIYLPDTNAFSAYLAGRSPALAKRMTEAVAAGEVRLSFMVLAELQFGAEKARRELGHTRFVKKVESLRDLLDVESLGEAVALCYATVRCQLEGAGIKIGDRDTLIAAHALALGAVLVTRNVREFSRVEGLVVENWQTE
jgi:tRNA(fMet)-specific endonuclease VapC